VTFGRVFIIRRLVLRARTYLVSPLGRAFFAVGIPGVHESRSSSFYIRPVTVASFLYSDWAATRGARK
jgi:hypothetical protein